MRNWNKWYDVMQYAIYVDNYKRRQLPNKMAIAAQKKTFYTPNQFALCLCKLPFDIYYKEKTMSACRWQIIIFFVQYNCFAMRMIKLFLISVAVWCVLWIPASITENLYDNLCNSNSHDWFFWLSNRACARSPLASPFEISSMHVYCT